MTRKLPYPDIISLAIYFTTEAYGHHLVVRTVNESAPQSHQKSTIKKKESKVCYIFDIVLVSCTELTDFSIKTKIWSYGKKVIRQCWYSAIGRETESFWCFSWLYHRYTFCALVRYVSSEKDTYLRVYSQSYCKTCLSIYQSADCSHFQAGEIRGIKRNETATVLSAKWPRQKFNTDH